MRDHIRHLPLYDKLCHDSQESDFVDEQDDHSDTSSLETASSPLLPADRDLSPELSAAEDYG